MKFEKTTRMSCPEEFKKEEIAERIKGLVEEFRREYGCDPTHFAADGITYWDTVAVFDDIRDELPKMSFREAIFTEEGEPIYVIEVSLGEEEEES